MALPGTTRLHSRARQLARAAWPVLLSAVALAACGQAGPGETPEAGASPAGIERAVLFLTGGGYHDFEGNPARLTEALEQRGWAVRTVRLGPDDAGAGEDLAWLESADLDESFGAVLAYTQGELGFSEGLRARLLAFVEQGGGLVGLHSAADSHPGWTGWDELIGARFETHPPFGPITVRVDRTDHPVTEGLPVDWELKDEFYHLVDVTTEERELLMSGVSPAGGDRRPVTWAAARERGRVVYTILGHGPETHGDPRYQQLVGQALAWVTAPR
jgi:hypothetical protein